jgi:UDP-glucuronate decarboxylase
MRKRVLVTGGAGFLGSHLCTRLIAEECDVLCVDNFYTGSKESVLPLLKNPHFELLRHDVTFPLYVEVDEIYNLACPASPPKYQSDPVQTIKTSVHGAINVLGLAKRLKARIFHASTSEVYDNPRIHPQVETHWGNVNPTGIRAPSDRRRRADLTLPCAPNCAWRRKGSISSGDNLLRLEALRTLADNQHILLRYVAVR